LNKLIELQDVHVYVTGHESPLLRGLNTSIYAGEWLAVTGRNGSGKSVLGKLLSGLEGRYTGQINRAYSDKDLAVRWVMQNPESQLIGETVWEDVCFGLENQGHPPEHIRVAALGALKQVGLEGFEDRPIHRLSGGQKQLVALAGAIATGPAVLVVDEVTSMLDPAARKRVLQVLKEFHHRGITIVMITQFLEELVYADRILAISNGAIEFEGSKEQFFYNGIDGGPGACEQLGLEPPYTVRVAKELINRGITVHGFPVTPEELGKAVNTG
jgi:energy-coupling factor transport system ATP-binding protein